MCFSMHWTQFLFLKSIYLSVSNHLNNSRAYFMFIASILCFLLRKITKLLYQSFDSKLILISLSVSTAQSQWNLDSCINDVRSFNTESSFVVWAWYGASVIRIAANAPYVLSGNNKGFSHRKKLLRKKMLIAIKILFVICFCSAYFVL